MKISLDYFEGEDSLSAQQYNSIIGFALLWGFALNILIIHFFSDFFMRMNPILLIVLYFILALGGTAIASFSRNPVMSFIGYNLVVIPVGAVLSVCLSGYDPQIIVRAIIATGIVVIVMTVASMIYPQVFLSLGRVLFIALALAIIAEIILLLLGLNPGWMDWLVVLIFCGYIGYDWARANAITKTADNAIDSVIHLYLDIINIFLRLLAIFGRSSNSSSD